MEKQHIIFKYREILYYVGVPPFYFGKNNGLPGESGNKPGKPNECKELNNKL